MKSAICVAQKDAFSRNKQLISKMFFLRREKVFLTQRKWVKNVNMVSYNFKLWHWNFKLINKKNFSPRRCTLNWRALVKVDSVVQLIDEREIIKINASAGGLKNCESNRWRWHLPRSQLEIISLPVSVRQKNVLFTFGAFRFLRARPRNSISALSSLNRDVSS